MRVVYESPIREKIDKVIDEAKRKIECIYVSEAEFDQMLEDGVYSICERKRKDVWHGGFATYRAVRRLTYRSVLVLEDLNQ